MFEKYFSVLDILIGLIWFGILFSVVSNGQKKALNEETKKYHVLGFLYKVFFGLFFTIAYYTILGGGDTKAYWDGTVVLNKLFFNDVGKYFEHLNSVSDQVAYIKHFNKDTGFPPGWIYREPEAWFVCKFNSLISLFTFRSLPANLVIYAFFLSRASIALLELVVRIGLHSTTTAAWCVQFVPSVAFWCTGISKDTIMFWTILNLVNILLSFLIFKDKLTLTKILSLAFFFFLVLNIRSFTLAAILAPLGVALSARLTNNFSSAFTRGFVRLIFLGVGIGGFTVIGSSTYVKDLADEAAVIQKDFAQNSIYTGKRYELDVSDPSPTGMLRAFPLSVFIGIYRPLIYESFTATLIFNGIESTILLLMTLNFLFNGNPIKKVQWIFKNEFLVFSLIFVLLIGFMAGYTSVLFGVLVRIRAPLLPFIFLIFSTRTEMQMQELKNEKELNKTST